MVNSTEVSVIHRFEIPTYCNVLEVSEDQQTVIAAGAYKPCLSVFDLTEHTVKLERNIDDEVVRVSILGEDWKKLALLHKHGRIEFHSRFGKHHTVDLPAESRDMQADLVRAEILCASKHASIYRFDTVQGKFQEPITTTNTGIESISLNRTNTIYGVSFQSGACEFIDSRNHSSIRSFKHTDTSLTACTFSEDGLYFATGSEDGIVSLYDLRSSIPLVTKDHNYEFPIKKIEISKNTITSMDKKAIKVWDRATTKTLAAIEPGFEINTFTSTQGIVLVGGDSPNMKTYYVPKLGSIPSWCSYLEASTEELLEIKKEIYFDNYKFLSEAQIKEQNLSSKIGNQIKPHLHGYLVPISLLTPTDP
ncbi:ribosome biogenesis protein ENP2 [Nematocida sp. AWRm80]|nr:ribosome biogenesis protein ENP2 [Nematocida sp. AWRm80]